MRCSRQSNTLLSSSTNDCCDRPNRSSSPIKRTFRVACEEAWKAAIDLNPIRRHRYLAHVLVWALIRIRRPPANWFQPDVVCQHRRVHVPVRLCDGQVRYEGRFRIRIKVRLLRTYRRIPYLGRLAGPHQPRRVWQSTPMSPIGDIVNGRQRITTPWHGGSARRSTPRPTSGRTLRPTTIC